MPEINIPFPGLYNSWLSQELETQEEREAENMEEREAETWPEPLRLSANDFGDMFWRAMNYFIAHESLARAYLEAFDAIAGEALGETRAAWVYSWAEKRKTRCRVSSCGFSWSIMTSPREYNFETDRLFVNASKALVNRLWARSREDGHETLRRVIQDRFTSCDGFISHYRNTLEDWPGDLVDWDHNQLGTLLIACLDLAGFDEESLLWATLEGETGYNAFDAGMDWETLEAHKMEKRIELLADWAERDSEALARWAVNNPERMAEIKTTDWDAVATLDLPQGDAVGAFYHCPETPDLFKSRKA